MTLGEVCDFQGGSQPPKEEWISEPREGYVRMLQIRDFTQSRSFEIEYVKESKRLKYCCSDDVLLGRYGASVGKVLTGLSGAYNVAIMKTIPNEKFLNKSLFRYFLQSPRFQVFLQTVSTMRAAQAGFSKEDIQDFIISIPSLPEQESIVAELDCLSGVIEKQKQQLKELDSLAQAIFYDMFGDPVTNEKGWEVKALGNMCDIINGFAFKSPLFTEDGDYILRISNIQDGYVDLKDVAYFHKSDYPKVNFEKYAVLPNDIVVALSGATTGKLGINKTGFKLYLNQRVAICREKSDKILREYLLYYLHEQSKKFLSDAAGVAQPNLSTEQMKEYKMCVPPVSVQQEFASKIEAIEKQKELIKQSLSETETLFNSRMDYYFN